MLISPPRKLFPDSGRLFPCFRLTSTPFAVMISKKKIGGFPKCQVLLKNCPLEWIQMRAEALPPLWLPSHLSSPSILLPDLANDCHSIQEFCIGLVTSVSSLMWHTQSCCRIFFLVDFSSTFGTTLYGCTIFFSFFDTTILLRRGDEVVYCWPPITCAASRCAPKNTSNEVLSGRHTLWKKHATWCHTQGHTSFAITSTSQSHSFHQVVFPHLDIHISFQFSVSYTI